MVNIVPGGSRLTKPVKTQGGSPQNLIRDKCASRGPKEARYITGVVDIVWNSVLLHRHIELDQLSFS